MSKRRPDVQLTRDNFDRESDEEGGEVTNEPKIASQEVLKSRPMVKAKRRLGSDNVEGSNGNTSSIFSGFKSTFGTGNSTNNTFGKINFGASPFNISSTPAFGASSLSASTFSDSKPVTTTIVQSNNDLKSKEATSNNVNIKKPESKETVPKKDDILNAHIKELNKAFYDHVKKYMDVTTVGQSDTPKLYDFTIVCQEYINQFKTIKERHSQTEDNSIQKENNVVSDSKKSDGLFKFGEKTSEPKSEFKIPQTGFAFGQSAPAIPSFGGAATNSKPTFNFGSGNGGGLFGSGFAASTPLTSKFALPAAVKENDVKDEGEGAGCDEEDTPPKVVSVEHSENDAVYTKKCKLYYQKDGSFKDKGLGFLYIILKDGARPQLLIRADTTTGNILLNIALVESLPVIKADKSKGVMLTCIPNPEIEPKKKDDNQENGDDKQTVTFLIRVKVSDNDELYDTILKYKSHD